MTNMIEIKPRIRAFIETNLFLQSAQDLRDSDSLLDHGVVDSTGFLELITFVESEFDLQVADTEMVLENFETIDRIAQFVARKRAA